MMSAYLLAAVGVGTSREVIVVVGRLMSRGAGRELGVRVLEVQRTVVNRGQGREHHYNVIALAGSQMGCGRPVVGVAARLHRFTGGSLD